MILDSISSVYPEIRIPVKAEAETQEHYRVSPFARKIAFTSYSLGSSIDVYTINIDGTSRVALTNLPSREILGDWSPDGTKLTIVSDAAGNGDIYTINADGSGLTRLTFSPLGEAQADWSSDGASIVFERYQDRNGTSDIYTIATDGTGVTTQITTGSKSEVQPGWQRVCPPLPVCG